MIIVENDIQEFTYISGYYGIKVSAEPYEPKGLPSHKGIRLESTRSDNNHPHYSENVLPYLKFSLTGDTNIEIKGSVLKEVL